MPIKTVLFDFMGTCLDWHSTIVSALPRQIPAASRSAFALSWRQTYFDANAARQAAGLGVEDIDITHDKTLTTMLSDPAYSGYAAHFTPEIRSRCIQAWHEQKAWPDVAAALVALRTRGYEIVVHANGTTRLQMDLCAASGLRFDMLVSSEILGVYKPAKENYVKALKLLKREPSECVLVAAHEYDTAGARTMGIKTVYVYRWTDDINEDQDQVRRDNDAYLDSMKGLGEAVDGLR